MPGLADVRYRAGIDREAFRREEAYLASRGHQGPPPHREEFDTEYMRALFQTGFEMAAKGNRWHKVPPGY